MTIGSQLFRRRLIGLTAGGGEHYAAAQGDLLGSAEGRSPFQKLLSITVAEG